MTDSALLLSPDSPDPLRSDRFLDAPVRERLEREWRLDSDLPAVSYPVSELFFEDVALDDGECLFAERLARNFGDLLIDPHMPPSEQWATVLATLKARGATLATLELGGEG